MSDLDGIRGALALCVVLLHFGFNSTFSALTGLNGFVFQLAVDLFFILSGFVIVHANRDRRPDIMRFVTGRIFRLVPVHWVTLALSMSTLDAALDGDLLALELLVLAPMAVPLPTNIAAWSVTWELYLPVLGMVLGMALLSDKARLRHVARFALPISCVAMAVACWQVARDQDLYALRAVLGLATGGMLRLSLRDEETLPDRRIYMLVVAMLAIMLGAGSIPAVAMLFPPCAIAVVAVGARTRSAFSSRPLQALGRISFTLYMVHMPVLSLMRAWAADMVDHNPAAKILGIALSLCMATLLTLVVERPMMQIGRRLARTSAATIATPA